MTKPCLPYAVRATGVPSCTVKRVIGGIGLVRGKMDDLPSSALMRIRFAAGSESFVLAIATEPSSSA